MPQFHTWNGGHRQKLISDDPPSRGIYLSAIDPSPSSFPDGAHVASAPSAKFIPIVGSFVLSPFGVVVARNLREAQELVNTTDQIDSI